MMLTSSGHSGVAMLASMSVDQCGWGGGVKLGQAKLRNEQAHCAPAPALLRRHPPGNSKRTTRSHVSLEVSHQAHICGSEIISHGSIREQHDHGQKLHHPDSLLEIGTEDFSWLLPV
jgi:hypothetical protein